ncbi:MAG: phosphatase [Faecalimonas sp.]|nr:phosphatase [Faecalimonas sp.]
MYEFDPHLHCIASGHGTTDTITDLAKQAKARQLNMIGLTDHGPATPHAGRSSYFRNLKYAPRKRCGIDILYGVELNILDYAGGVDLEDEILETLDYAIISMHLPTIRPGSVEENTFAYVNAMAHPQVKIIGHCEDTRYPVDYEALLIAARHYGVVFEINNCSLSPEGYRGDVRENVRTILELCKRYRHPIVLSSDSHGKKNVGQFKYAAEMLKETRFPKELVLNRSSAEFRKYIQK